MEIKMIKDKVTKNTVRYADGDGHNLYLKNEEVEELGNPKAIEVTIEPR